MLFRSRLHVGRDVGQGLLKGRETVAHLEQAVLVEGLHPVAHRDALQLRGLGLGVDGGDEFLVLLPETSCSGAAGVATRVRHRIESTPLHFGSATIPVTVSIGVACFPDHGSTFEAVLKAADDAMYVSKKEGKNRATLSQSR